MVKIAKTISLLTIDIRFFMIVIFFCTHFKASVDHFFWHQWLNHLPVNIWMTFRFLSGFSFTQHAWFIGQQRKRESNSSVIKRKGEPQIRCYKKRKHAIFFEKRICARTRACVSRVRNVRFSKNLACFVFF